jgi:hypothetical protein
MSEALRGFVLLLSVVLWLPCLLPLIDGEMSTAEAGLRYGAALLFAWGACAAVAALLKAYAPEPVEDDDTHSAAVATDRRGPSVETAKAEVLVERRAQPRDDDAIAT